MRKVLTRTKPRIGTFFGTVTIQFSYKHENERRLTCYTILGTVEDEVVKQVELWEPENDLVKTVLEVEALVIERLENRRGNPNAMGANDQLEKLGYKDYSK